MIWLLLQQIGFFIFVILTLYYVIKGNYINLLALYFAGFVFSACNYFFITIWTPDKIVSLGMAYCIIFHRNSYRNQIPSQLKNILIFLVILLCISSIIGFVSIPRYTYLINPKLRIILANFSYITTSIALIIGILLPIRFRDDFFKKYCRVMELAILTGLLHFICLTLGVEFMPINRAGLVENTIGSDVIAEFGGSIITRIYGFAGEPKGLAFCVLPYLVISITMFLQNNFIKSKIYHLIFLCLGLFVLFQTYSSSALINIIILLPLIIILGGVKPSPTFMAVLFIGFILLLVYSTSSENGLSGFFESLNQRTFERGQNELANDRQESVIMKYYDEEGFFVKTFGWGLGQYTFNVPGQVFGNSILIPVQSGLVLTIADFGVLGLALYLYLTFVVIGLVAKVKRFNSPITLSFAMASLSKLIESTMHGNITTSFVYLAIAYYMFIYENKFTNN